MKKIIYTPIPMQPDIRALYSLNEETAKSRNLDYSAKIYFPINAYIFDCLSEGDEVKVCFIELSEDGFNDELNVRYKQNETLFKTELQTIAKPFNAKIEYESVKTDFSESADIFSSRFVDLYNCLEKDCEIYADITFGAKTNTLLIYNILNFAEQFFDCSIEAIVYGKTVFTKNQQGETAPSLKVSKVCDVTSLYYLTKLTEHIKAASPEEAVEKIKEYLKI